MGSARRLDVQPQVVRPSSGGLRSRTATQGPEVKLVEAFLPRLQTSLKLGKDCALTIFMEPFLDSGAPDIVAVAWHVPTAVAIRDAVVGIHRDSLRLLHHLTSSMAGPTPPLETVFGRRTLGRALGELEERGLARREGGSARTLPSLGELFAVRSIVALEAKVGNSFGALQQAGANRWFASESYALLPRAPSDAAVQRAVDLGVGVWISEDARPMVRVEIKVPQPVSWASWLFNGWVIGEGSRARLAS